MKDSILEFIDDILGLIIFSTFVVCLSMMLTEITAIVPNLPKEEYVINA